MKKLFSVLLVLALCGIASADVTYYLTDSAGNSEITLTPSDTVTLYLWYTGDSIISFNTQIIGTGPGTLTATVGNASDWDPPVAMPNITAAGRTIAYDGVQVALDMTDPEYPVPIPNSYKVTGSADSGMLGKGNPTALAFVLFHCDSASPPDVVITLIDVTTYDTSWNQVGVDVLPAPIMNGMIIHQIPEPATIALLCLGGLLLRKKK
jgi:hypothetical protein